MNKFLFRMLAFSVTMVLMLYVLNYFVPGFEIVPFYLFSILYYTMLNTGIYLWLFNKLKEENRKFMFAFYISTMIRLFGSLIVLAIYLLFIRQVNLKESVVFIILYFFYTAFEVVNLIPNLRPGNKKEQ
jgi:hypothetical protein